MKWILALTLTVLFLSSCSKADGDVLHPHFNLALEDLEAMTAGLPDDLRNDIRSNPGGFLERIQDLLDVPVDLFLLADKENDLGEGYVPPDLARLDDFDFHRGRPELMLRSIVIPDAIAMAATAENQGVTLVFSSAYRSYAYQKRVYERNVRQVGQEQADRESARPGNSQHQLGTTVDFGSITDEFADTPAGKWLYANAWEFGFSLSYPDGYESLTGYRHEIWHYRYISRPAAHLERLFFGSIQYYLLVFLTDHLETLRDAYSPRAGTGS